VLAREGTVTAAAHALSVAPSAVSRRLKAIEERLGVELVRRDTRRSDLTSAGRTYLEGAERVLGALDALEEGLRAEAGTIAGVIRVTAPLSFGLSVLPDALSGFMAAHPAVRLDLHLTDEAVDILGEGFDLALRIGALASSSLVARRLCAVPFAACASPSFVAERGPFRSPHDLEGLPGLVYTRTPRAEVLSWTGPGGEEGSASLAPVLRADNGDLLAMLAARGHGVTCEPRFILAGHIERGELIELFPDHAWPSLDLFAVRPPGAHVPARLRALIDHLARALKS
jgi:DNA-binding transcriptional LysR family regulator